jgi:hypothetical protein
MRGNFNTETHLKIAFRPVKNLESGYTNEVGLRGEKERIECKDNGHASTWWQEFSEAPHSSMHHMDWASFLFQVPRQFCDVRSDLNSFETLSEHVL